MVTVYSRQDISLITLCEQPILSAVLLWSWVGPLRRSTEDVVSPFRPGLKKYRHYHNDASPARAGWKVYMETLSGGRQLLSPSHSQLQVGHMPPAKLQSPAKGAKPHLHQK